MIIGIGQVNLDEATIGQPIPALGGLGTTVEGAPGPDLVGTLESVRWVLIGAGVLFLLLAIASARRNREW